MVYTDLEQMFGDLDIFPMIPLNNCKDARAVGFKDGVLRVFRTNGDLVDISPATEKMLRMYVVSDREQ